MKVRRKTSPSAAIIPLALFIVSAAVYMHCLSPNWGAVSEFNTWDGIEYTLCSTLLGIDHPPGHPLYLLLGKIATLWPGASPSRMINMISAIAGAITIVLLYAGLLHIIKHREDALPVWWCKAASAAISLGFGFSYVFWSHCEIPEVHTLFTALLAGMIAAALRWQVNRRGLWLNVAALSAGLAVGVNILAIFAALPPLILFVWLVNREDTTRRTRLLPPALIFLCGFLIYIYYPIRMASAPFSHPMNLMAPYPLGTMGWYWWYVSGAAWTGGKMFFLTRVVFNLGIYWRFLLGNLGIPMLILAFVGMASFFGRLFFPRPENIRSSAQSPRLRPGYSTAVRTLPASLKLGLFLSALFVFIAVPELSIHDPSNPQATDYLANFFLPSLLIIFYWVAAGLSCACAFLFSRRRERERKALQIVTALCLFAFPVWQYARNFTACDLSDKQEAYIVAREAVTSIPENSLILSKLVYPQAVSYFSRIEQLIQPGHLEIVNPDEEAAALAREAAPPGCTALFSRKNRALLELIEDALAAGRTVFIAGDAVEFDKSPEKMLIADVKLRRWPPLPPLPGAPRELNLYMVEGLRKALPSTDRRRVAGRGIANDGCFANGIRLLGYSREPTIEIKHGGLLLNLNLLWEAGQPPATDLYTVVTVLDNRMTPLPGTAVWYTLGGRRPPTTWQAGEAVEERVACLLPPLRTGNYFLALGLVDCNNNRIKYLPSRPTPGGAFDYVLFTAFNVP